MSAELEIAIVATFGTVAVILVDPEGTFSEANNILESCASLPECVYVVRENLFYLSKCFVKFAKNTGKTGVCVHACVHACACVCVCTHVCADPCRVWMQG